MTTLPGCPSFIMMGMQNTPDNHRTNNQRTLEELEDALQTEKAKANKNTAQASAETRRALAVATEQEMKAKTQEMRAKVVEAEAQVPMAMAEAFRKGNLGVMDYYRMQNVQADSKMRSSLAGEDTGKSGSTS